MSPEIEPRDMVTGTQFDHSFEFKITKIMN